MEPQFDRFAKLLARGTSRRALLVTMVKAAVGGGAAAFLGSRDVSGQSSQPGTLCTWIYHFTTAPQTEAYRQQFCYALQKFTDRDCASRAPAPTQGSCAFFYGARADFVYCQAGFNQSATTSQSAQPATTRATVAQRNADAQCCPQGSITCTGPGGTSCCQSDYCGGIGCCRPEGGCGFVGPQGGACTVCA